MKSKLESSPSRFGNWIAVGYCPFIEQAGVLYIIDYGDAFSISITSGGNTFKVMYKRMLHWSGNAATDGNCIMVSNCTWLQLLTALTKIGYIIKVKDNVRAACQKDTIG